ncbi:hypothetical protein Ga0123462_0409 [Mariprofundus ferrinatatus]|uniref:Uncharacterized protein n=1 Tax=Mariprofundus ferrinatatus TaxID=1921087 RepID=A0A2K8L8M7_9PROT|nr:hypothetical protein Ga0123462_0409 [Mariprofundus ferrinatatus]
MNSRLQIKSAVWESGAPNSLLLTRYLSIVRRLFFGGLYIKWQLLFV